MKTRISTLNWLLLSVILNNFCITGIFSQTLKSDDWKQPGFFVGGGVGISKTQIINDAGQEISISQATNCNSVIESVEIGYFFSRYLGFTIGVNYYQYRSNFFIDAYQNNFNTIDNENDPYELRISGNDIEEIQQFEILNIPFCMNIHMTLNKVIGAYLQTGINLFVPISEFYRSTGTFTYKGYFPTYNVVLEELPEYGFPSDLRIQSEGEPKLKPVSYGFVTSLGIDYLFNKRVQFRMAVYFDRSFSSVLANTQIDEFYLTTNAEHVNSILGCASKVSLQSFGSNIGVRYYFTDYNKFKYYSRPSVKRNLREYERQRKRILR